MKISLTTQSKNSTPLGNSHGSNNIKIDTFSKQFQSFKHKNHQEHLTNLLKKIKKKGDQVLKSRSIKAANEYKIYIKEYLSFILDTSYHVKQLYTMWGGESLSIVTIIDQELDELGKMILNEEKDTMVLIDKINEIQGLLISVYR